jgi:hypothetical protein
MCKLKKSRYDKNCSNCFRQIGKAPDGTRIYWPLKEKLPAVDVPCINQPEPFMEHLDPSSKHVIVEAPLLSEGHVKNERASFLVGHLVDGDAILATAGSTWQSDGRCIYADFNLSCFHRFVSSQENCYEIFHMPLRMQVCVSQVWKMALLTTFVCSWCLIG